MDIAATSIGLSTASVQQEVSLSLLKKTMESAESQAISMVNQMMPSAPTSKELGSIIDVYA